jgi:hypothetical protein
MEEENIFDESIDYTKKGETYQRENYKAWVQSLPQKTIYKILADNIGIK